MSPIGSVQYSMRNMQMQTKTMKSIWMGRAKAARPIQSPTTTTTTTTTKKRTHDFKNSFT